MGDGGGAGGFVHAWLSVASQMPNIPSAEAKGDGRWVRWEMADGRPGQQTGSRQQAAGSNSTRGRCGIGGHGGMGMVNGDALTFRAFFAAISAAFPPTTSSLESFPSSSALL